MQQGLREINSSLAEISSKAFEDLEVRHASRRVGFYAAIPGINVAEHR
jgi:hypothetical protein